MPDKNAVHRAAAALRTALVGKQLVGFEVGYTVRQSHAGLNLELALLGYSVAFQIYDNRHWDYDRHAYTQTDS
jgi:hypothetical protein